MNKKDTYRNYAIWSVLILFYVVFYLISNYAWIEEIDLQPDDPFTTSKIQSPSLFSETTSDDTLLPKKEKEDAIRKRKNRGNIADYKKPSRPIFRKKQITKMVPINKANQSEWEMLYNIGPYRASRIIIFRHALGGFYAVDQVSETYGLPDSVFQEIKSYLSVDSTYNHININEVAYD